VLVLVEEPVAEAVTVTDAVLVLVEEPVTEVVELGVALLVEEAVDVVE
jgi:hypothetical protein